METSKTVDDIIRASWEISCLAWIEDNKIKTEKGTILEFKNHRYLRAIFEDWSPIMTTRKASQVGFSTMIILKTLYAAKYKGYNVIYTLPTVSDVNQFVPSKVNSIISHNSILQSWTQDKDSILQKKVGNSFIYYRGTFSGKTEKEKSEAGVGIMLSSDLNAHDEVDRSDQFIIEQYESRLQSSNYKGRWYFSNPTHPDTLADRLWQQSDQKYWFVKCEHCGEWQYLSWPDSIDPEKKVFVCKKCHKELSDETRANGKWIKKYNNREISGYWINHLMCPYKKASEILNDYETKTKDYFYNFVLGLPYRGSDIVIDRDIILRCLDDTEETNEHNVMGVDQGLDKHYVIGNSKGIFKIGVTRDWKEIEDLIKKYDIEVAVFDALPDLTEPRKLRDKYPGKIWLNYYKKEVKSSEFIKWDKDTRTVYTDRTKIFQQVIDELMDRKIRFRMNVDELQYYIKHWESLYKITEKDSLGIERDEWETDGDDHYAHATIYWRLALMKCPTGGGVLEYNKGGKIINYNEAPNIQEFLKKD